MPSRTNSRAASTARKEILDQLKQDHQRVKKAYREFSKLNAEEDPQRCETLVNQVLSELEVHATLEEELLYPAAHDAIAEPDLVDEAEVEHEMVRVLIEQLKTMDAQDEKYAARFTVLCEYVLHHVKEEEKEMFPQLERARLDWETLAQEMRARRQELTPPDEGEVVDGDSERTGLANAAPAKTAGKPRAGSDQGTAAQPGEAMNSRRV